MKKILLLLLLSVGLISCNEDGSPVLELLHTGNLPVQYYDINIDRDTTLHTQQGAELWIPKGAITNSSQKKVRLAIKEAYRIEDMIKAGLQTKSGNRMLSSGGMISVKAEEDNAAIVQPIRITLPSTNTEQDMQLFRGKEGRDGTIDWTDPVPLLPNKTLDSIAAGKTVFRNNCAPCHDPMKDATGPNLAFVPQRRDRKWMAAFIRNSAQLIASGDRLANCLYEHWNKTAMTAFPALTDEELEKLYRYLDQESKNLDPARYPDFQASLDSCALYEKARQVLTEHRDVLIQLNGPEVKFIYPNAVAHPYKGPENTVVPKNNYSTYYQFNITNFGWYNVDVFTDNLPGYIPSVLKARLTGAYTGHTNIFLIIPDARVFVGGGLLEGETAVYGFYTDDGKVPLPQGKKAYIMAFTEHDGQITFALVPFNTSRDNELTLTPVIITKAEMNKRVKALDLKALVLEARDAPNADSIRAIDIRLKQVELLKPKGAQCDCGFANAGDTGMISEMR